LVSGIENPGQMPTKPGYFQGAAPEPFGRPDRRRAA
jgi:hypothetical protein